MVRYILPILLLTTAAQAQQSPAVDRISAAYGQCVGKAEQMADQIADLQKRLEAAEAIIAKKTEATKPNAKP